MKGDRSNEGLKNLGSKKTKYSANYCPSVLERFQNKFQSNDYFITFNCPEGTSLCPITSQPDNFTLYINYIPDQYCVESKSLKLYLFSFRNEGMFHEDIVNIVHNDLKKLLNPKYIEVLGEFLPRGGISIDPFVNSGKTDHWIKFAEQRLLMRNIEQKKVDNR